MKSTCRTDVMWQCLAISIFSTCAVTACSSGDSDGPVEVSSPPSLSFMPATDSALASQQKVSSAKLVKNGLYLMQTQQANPPPSVDFGAPEMSAADSYSTTNTQIDGVDEADRIEYNGDYLFVADLPVWTDDQALVKNVRILERQEDYSLEETASFALESKFNVAGMYLYSDTLGVVSHSFPFYPLEMTFVASDPWQQPENDTRVDVYDVSDPTAPAGISQIRIDGGLVSSRRIDNNLFIATQYLPSVEDLPKTDGTDESLVNLYKAILAVDDSELVPKITINDQRSDLFSLDDCLIPESATDKDGHVQMVSVVKINLDNPTDYSAVCLLTQASGLFASSDNLYLHANIEEETVFHKVSLGDEIRYQASGSVEGVLGWRSSAQFKMAERDGKFIAVTTSNINSGEPEHGLHVLEQQGNALEEIATLPNDSQPAPIGKPGEEIYAVRYFEDKAYIVTFERIDPLYVIDLTDVANPMVAGELEIPGFSSYLHPMENGLLLGVGQQVSSELIPESGAEPVALPVQEGMKVTLFDVLDPANPIVLNELVWADTYTPVEYDHRALSVLKTDTGYHFAIPTETWGVNDDERWYTDNSLQTIDINEGSRSMTLVDSITPPEDEEFYFGSYEDRSVLHGEHIYYLRGNDVYHALWQTHSPIRGPY